MEWSSKVEREYIRLARDLNAFESNDSPMPNINKLTDCDKEDICEAIEEVKENCPHLSKSVVITEGIRNWYNDNIF